MPNDIEEDVEEDVLDDFDDSDPTELVDFVYYTVENVAVYSGFDNSSSS